MPPMLSARKPQLVDAAGLARKVVAAGPGQCVWWGLTRWVQGGGLWAWYWVHRGSRGMQHEASPTEHAR